MKFRIERRPSLRGVLVNSAGTKRLTLRKHNRLQLSSSKVVRGTKMGRQRKTNNTKLLIKTWSCADILRMRKCWTTFLLFFPIFMKCVQTREIWIWFWNAFNPFTTSKLVEVFTGISLRRSCFGRLPTWQLPFSNRQKKEIKWITN